MPNKNFLILFVFGLSLPLLSNGGLCKKLVDDAFSSTKQSYSKEDFEKNYRIVKSIEPGKSGDLLYQVVDKADQQSKVIKEFTEPAEIGGKGYWEIYITCRNSNLAFYPLFQNMTASSPLALGTFFPKFYGVGKIKREKEKMVPTDNPNEYKTAIVQENHPFMVMEALSGQDLKDSIAKLKLMSPKELLSIVYQIALATNVATETYGFKHFDLHPGNIRILDERIHLTTKDGIKLDAPRVVIFDFGQSRANEYTEGHGFISNIDKRLDTQTLDRFVSSFGLDTGTSFLSGSDTVPKKAAAISKNQDVRFFNQIFAAVWVILKDKKFVDDAFPYCGPSMSDCLQLGIFSQLK